MTEENLMYPVLCSSPVVSKRRFIELSGFSEGIVKGWIDRGQLPTVLIGKHRAVNMALITSNCLAQLPLDNDDN